MNQNERIVESMIAIERAQSFARSSLRAFYILNNILKGELPKNGDLFIENIEGVNVLFWIVFQGDPSNCYRNGLEVHAKTKGLKEFVDYDIDMIVGFDEGVSIDDAVNHINSEMEMKSLYIRKCLLHKLL